MEEATNDLKHQEETDANTKQDKLPQSPNDDNNQNADQEEDQQKNNNIFNYKRRKTKKKSKNASIYSNLLTTIDPGKKAVKVNSSGSTLNSTISYFPSLK